MVFMPHAQQVQLKISFYIDVAILYVFFCANIRLTLKRKSPQRKKVTRFFIFAYYGHALLMEMKHRRDQNSAIDKSVFQFN